ncbi:ATP-binding protein [Maribacter algarum]|uniref:ATP-binding protein n=1 Tax=Maribacter algarum (ex Zhang et al. 2020) TaxID=2578118 RepID=A0A5S3PX17_9FLAO|nr:ATP-binding protein [Maribacter algarum]TMM57548.1 ATP-binding protein [Maribacter algarum]
MHLNTKRVVITGGPSTGKTAVIDVLEQKGYHCLEEVIRAMTLAKKENESDVVFETNPIVSVTEPMAFNQMILDARIAQYESTANNSEEIVFFDRGIPDVLAYMDCFQQEYGKPFTEACKNNLYDVIFLMPPWKEIHVVDNERFESYEESLRIHECLEKSYSSFGYDVQIVPKDTILNRVDFILEHLKQLK